MADIELSRGQLDQFCCVDLIRAEADQLVATASGGVWIGYAKGCLSGLPLARFCPFCGAKIITTHHDGGGWSWRTEPRRESTP